jgi:hypothetical protein
MSDVETTVAEPTEAQAAEQAAAGYARRTRGDTTPPVSAPAPEQTPAESVDASPGESDGDAAVDVQATTAPAPSPAPAEPDLKTELATLKARVQEMAGAVDPQELRRLHGQVGDLNRTIKSLEAAKTASADDEFAAALKRAEAVATEYPELGQPMVDAIRLLGNRQPQAATPPAPAAQPANPEHEDRIKAIKAIDEAHPDRLEINATAEFQTWIRGKTPEYQSRYDTSWNPAVVSPIYAEYKLHRDAEKARAAARAASAEEKRTRLAAGVTPQGVPVKAQPTTLPDEEGFSRGYARRKRHS